MILTRKGYGSAFIQSFSVNEKAKIYKNYPAEFKKNFKKNHDQYKKCHSIFSIQLKIIQTNSKNKARFQIFPF